MKRSSQLKLTKELKLLLFTFGIIIILLYFALPDYYYYRTLYVQAQVQQQQQLPPIISLKITSPVTNQVPGGQLTISGISTDNATSDCTVYADWNNTKPFQKAVATGPGGVDDYSTWTFTYTDKYHLITNGTNNLTSKLSCLNNGSNNSGIAAANITKSYSINVIGVTEPSQRQLSSLPGEEQQNSNISNGVSSSLPPVKGNNNTKTGPTITTSPESIPSVPIRPQPAPGNNNENTTIYWDMQ